MRFDDYCIVGSGFVRQRPDLVARIIAAPLTLYATPLVLSYIVQHFGIEQMRCRVFLLDDFRFPAGRRGPSVDEPRAAHGRETLALFDEPEALGFSLDIRRGVFDGRTVAQLIVDQAAVVNRSATPSGPGYVGVVVGATVLQAPDLSALGGPVLVPGLGVQGGRPEALAGLGGAEPGQLLPAVAREVLRAGPGVAELRDAAGRMLDAVAYLAM